MHQPNAPWQAIVVGFDGTDGARCAVTWAADQAARHSCPLHVVRVLEPMPVPVAWGPVPVPVPAREDGDELRRVEEQVAVAMAEIRARMPGVDVHAEVLEGRAPVRLAAHADLVGADLVVVGASEQGSLARLLLGVTALELVGGTERPVVAVRDLTPVQEAAALVGQPGVVAMADDLATSAPVLELAFDVAARTGSDLMVVCPATAVPGRIEADPHLAGYRERYPGVGVAVETATDNPARVVLERAECARLLVVGDRRQGPVRRLLSGSVSHTVLHRAACSVAVVKVE